MYSIGRKDTCEMIDKSIKMILTDLDGTILRSDKSISDYTLKIIEYCKSKNILFGIATARSEKSSQTYISKLSPDIIISNGGALVTYNKKVIYLKKLSYKMTDNIISECLKTKKVKEITAETDKGYFVSYQENSWHNDYMHGIYHDFNNKLGLDTYKLTIEISDEKTAIDVSKIFDGIDFLRFRDEDWYKFSHKLATKHYAIEYLCKHLGINLSNVLVFGDDYNDIDMLKICGTGVAVENAIDGIKDVADYICKNNDEDGVAKFISKNILNY